MALVNDSDVQVHLPVDKLELKDVPDSLTDVNLDVERVIKGRLSGTFSPTTLADWTTPDSTPKYIRAIGGRLAAALLYRLRLSQDYPDDAEYAQIKYSEAMMMLDMVVAGTVVLEEVTEVVDTGGHLTQDYYTTGTGDPKFTMDKVF